jgi:NAD(P)-dependent dehydrogenase (short-subunit alcohol dehydrogenase family)
MDRDRTLTGRTILVTGSTSGIGLATAEALARMGAAVIVHGRNADKAKRVVTGLIRATGNQQVSFVQADFASLADVRRLAEELDARLPRLDVLINNAGTAVIGRSRTLTGDGYEMTFAVNHLAPFLLTNLLLDKIKKSMPARIIVVASEAHRTANLDLDDLMGERGGVGFRAYSRSKLANILFTRTLAKRLEGSGVTINAVHPGVVHTGLLSASSTPYKLIMILGGWLMKSPQQGASTSIYLASSSEVDGRSGGYYADCAPSEPTAEARDDVSGERLWQLSANLVGLF